MSTGVRILLLFGLIGANAFFVACEYAIVTVRRWRLVELADAGDHRAGIAVDLLDDPMRLIGTVQVGISALGIGLGALGEPTLRDIFDPVLAVSVSVALSLIITTYLYVVLGELVPRAIALERTEAFTLVMARPLALLNRVARPVVWLLQGSATAILRPLGFKPISTRLAVRSEEELRGVVAEAEDTGIIEEAEEEMLYKVFDFAATEVRDVMVPRPDIAALSADMPLRECLAAVIDSPYTRHPVYRDNLDNVIGVLHLRDIFSAYHHHRLEKTRIEDLLRPVHLIPETKNLGALLTEFRRNHQQMAIVLDEYGGTEGLVTLEDLLEEIVGEIADEYDLPDESIRWVDARTARIDGTFPLDDFAEQFGVDIPSEPYHTLAGLVLDRLGRLPRVGDAVRVNGLRLRVLAVKGLRVSVIEVAFPRPPARFPSSDRDQHHLRYR
ncbi:MAG TPA: hemolysin family protein [Solirubrobacteraceae bacterium]|nr:hemolysin family protein [Solirubrobacteraceae bacterium]